MNRSGYLSQAGCAFLVIAAVTAFFLFFRKSIIGNPPPVVDYSKEELLFAKFRETNNPQYLFEIVDTLTARKLSDLSLSERYLLIDALTLLSKIFPNDVEIRMKMAMTSFLFGAYSKSLEITSALIEDNTDNQSLRSFYVLNLIVGGALDKAVQELGLMTDSFEKKNLENYIKFKRGLIDQETFSSNLVGGYIADLIDLAESKVRISHDYAKANLIHWFYSHHILGDKIESHRVADRTLFIVLKNFPIKLMPPEVKSQLILKVQNELKKQTDIDKVYLTNQNSAEDSLVVFREY